MPVGLLLSDARLGDTRSRLELVEDRHLQGQGGAEVAERVGVVERTDIEVLRTEPALFEERSKNEDRIVPVGEGLAEL